jgi:hypothetical protein
VRQMSAVALPHLTVFKLRGNLMICRRGGFLAHMSLELMSSKRQDKKTLGSRPDLQLTSSRGILRLQCLAAWSQAPVRGGTGILPVDSESRPDKPCHRLPARGTGNLPVDSESRPGRPCHRLRGRGTGILARGLRSPAEYAVICVHPSLKWSGFTTQTTA